MNGTPTPSNAVPLDLPRLAAALADDCRDWIIDCVAETGSTNADLMARFADPAAPIRPRLDRLDGTTTWAQAAARFVPIVRLAGQQSAGRGRLGRRWWSAPGDSLLFSVGVVIPRPIAGLSGLSLAVGAAVIDGLRRLPIGEPARLALKWPNDILLDDAKLGGILIETAASNAHASAVVIGIGLNLRGTPMLGSELITDSAADSAADAAATPHSARPKALPPASLASALSRSGQDNLPADPLALPTDTLAAIMGALASMLEQFSAAGFAVFQDRWWAMHRFAGRAVSIVDGDQVQMQGTAVGVDAWGRLLIDSSTAGNDDAAASHAASEAASGAQVRGGGHRLHAITAGDVSLRVLSDPS